MKEATDKEQFLADTIAGIASSRRETMDNIATVLNKNKEDLKVTDVIEFLDAQPEFRDPLAAINEKLAKLAKIEGNKQP